MCYRSHSICAEQPIFANNLRLYTMLDSVCLPLPRLRRCLCGHDAGPRTDRDFTQDCGVRCDVNIAGKHRICTQEPVEPLQNLVKIHKTRLMHSQKVANVVNTTKLGAFARNPAWILDSQ